MLQHTVLLLLKLPVAYGHCLVVLLSISKLLNLLPTIPLIVKIFSRLKLVYVLDAKRLIEAFLAGPLSVLGTRHGKLIFLAQTLVFWCS